jgi:glycosyltransferase involved in cell wall biosynthesis
VRVSGFTIVRNGVKLCYPFKEAILSVLPLCDEFIVNVGDSDDGTADEVRSIADEKITIMERKWDMKLRSDGRLLSEETNRALERCKGEWCFYIQSDEVLHEKYISTVRAAMIKYANDSKAEGLRFTYKHFYGSYDYFQDNYRKWYIREVRVIKNGRDIVSWGDAMGFKHRDGSQITAQDIEAEIYHYGYVRPPEAMLNKTTSLHTLYHNDEEVSMLSDSFKLYSDLGNLKKFEGSHPAVMENRVKSYDWSFDPRLEEQRPDWLRAILIFLYPVTKRVKRLIGKKDS